MGESDGSASVRAKPRPGVWRLLSSEAHRLMFFCGALQAVAAMAWWVFDLAARHLQLYPVVGWTVPAAWAHAWLLGYGLFPFFIFGFLMTAGPNWLGAQKTPRIAFVPAALLMAAGLVLFYSGLVAARPLAALGVLVHAAGWLWGVAFLMRLAARHWNPNARYAVLVFSLLAVGLVLDAAFGFALATGAYGLVPLVLTGTVWFFLLPVFLAVATRMVPFFSSRVLGSEAGYKPGWARPVLISGALAHGVLELGQLHAWLWLVDLPLAALVAHLAWRWGLAKSGSVRLLAVLHLSLGVLAAALALYAGLSLALATGAAERVGLAGLHLLVIGFLATMALGMVSRVSLGHSGRELEADALTWRCYLALVAAGVARAAAEPYAGTAVATALTFASALLWLGAFGAWGWRYAPMFLMPRVEALLGPAR